MLYSRVFSRPNLKWQMENDVREAIIHLEEDIAEAKTHIELLEQPADKGLSEELNHKFCKTNLWQSNILGAATI